MTHLFSEASHADATGEVIHVESEPMGRILARMDAVLPRSEHYAWFMEETEELGGQDEMKSPAECILEGDLESVQQLLDGMPETEPLR